MPASLQNVLLEIAVDNAESVLAAVRGGAQRLELCSSLSDGGLTPGIGFVAWARAQTERPLHCMVRPRAGDFCYSAAELTIMEQEIAAMCVAGADGIVMGVLTAEARVDVQAMRQLIDRAKPMRVTFHRAFDLVADLAQGLDDVIACGAEVLLTSGGAPTLELGLPVVTGLVKQAAARIEIMGGAGVRLNNAQRLWEQAPIDTLHASLRGSSAQPTQADSVAAIGNRSTVHEEDVRAMLAMLRPRLEREHALSKMAC